MIIYISVSYEHTQIKTKITSHSNQILLGVIDCWTCQVILDVMYCFIPDTLIYISANGDSYSSVTPPTFISESSSATLRFTSDYDLSYTGILMVYLISKYSSFQLILHW